MCIRDSFTGAPRPQTWYSSALANKLAGEDLEPEEDDIAAPVSSTHPRAHETVLDLVCRLLLETQPPHPTSTN